MLDKNIFYFVNHTMHVWWLDSFMILLRTPSTWIPLYLFLIYWLYKNERKMLLPFLIASVATFAITDYVSAALLKPLFERLRPCYDDSLQSTINSLVDCGGQYSMPSSHAANHFGLAMLWYWLILFLRGKKWNWVWFWAGIICFAQVYVGVHFPFDILCGAFLGIVTATSIAKIFEFWFAKRNKIHSLFSSKQFGH